jgi:hypothetical protein
VESTAEIGSRVWQEPVKVVQKVRVHHVHKSRLEIIDAQEQDDRGELEIRLLEIAMNSSNPHEAWKKMEAILT